MNNKTLGGSTFIRNAVELDYPVWECVRSMLGVCDRVLVLECGSTDGTPDILNRLLEEFPDRLTVRPFPFTLRQEGHRWLLKAINHARITLMGMGLDWHLQLDADEVLHERDYTLIRECVDKNRPQFLFRRNFWGRPDVQLKDDVVCGTWVARLAPVSVVNVSDEPYPRHKTPLSRLISKKDGIELFHYGFCRRRKNFFEKAKLMEGSYFGRYRSEWDTLNPEDDAGFAAVNAGQTFPYAGTHPKVVHEWLRDRGFEWVEEPIEPNERKTDRSDTAGDPA